MSPGARSTRAQQHPHSPGARRKSLQRLTAILEFSPLILPISSTCSRTSPKYTRLTEWTRPSPKQFGLPSSLRHRQNDHSHPSDLLPLSFLRFAAHPSVPPLSDSRSSLLIFSRRFEHILFKLWICFCNTHICAAIRANKKRVWSSFFLGLFQGQLLCNQLRVPTRHKW